VLTAEQIRAVAHYVTDDLAVIPLVQGNIGDGGKPFAPTVQLATAPLCAAACWPSRGETRPRSRISPRP
jgi:hypothetical protein